MIHFIICDDNKIDLQNIEELINRVMMKNKLIYVIHKFPDYNESFMKISEEKLSNKIYILDIETPSASGIDIARRIREKDIESILIFLTNYNELGSAILQDELMFLTFICKLNKKDARLESAIQTSLRMLGEKRMIRFEEKGALYTISLEDILYITHDNVERKSVIVTDKIEYHVHKSLLELKEMLDERFCQTHRSCIVNTKRIRIVNKSNNEIIFDNGLKIDLLSKNYRKELSACLESS